MSAFGILKTLSFKRTSPVIPRTRDSRNNKTWIAVFTGMTCETQSRMHNNPRCILRADRRTTRPTGCFGANCGGRFIFEAGDFSSRRQGTLADEK